MSAHSSQPLVSDQTADSPEQMESITQASVDQQGPQGLQGKDSKRKRFFGLIKKKLDPETGKEVESVESDKQSSKERSVAKAVEPAPGVNSPVMPMTPTSNPIDGAMSPQSPLSASTSPSRLPFRSSSPRLLSPASSLIFERNVQENALPDDLSSAIPSHIQTEDHIPAVLEASSIAITNDHLDPSEVEIVTHSVHQPAALSVAASTLHGDQPASPLSPALSVQHHYHDLSDGMEDSIMTAASSYGAIDTTDVRRLSFISFADVVQGEHAESQLASGAVSLASPTRNRSPSPLRSPRSSSSAQQSFHGAASSSPDPAAIKGGIPIARSPPVPLSPDAMSMGFGMGNLPVSPPGGGEIVTETMSDIVKAAVGTAELHDTAGR